VEVEGGEHGGGVVHGLLLGDARHLEHLTPGGGQALQSCGEKGGLEGEGGGRRKWWKEGIEWCGRKKEEGR
jgi:hypothetical protein